MKAVGKDLGGKWTEKSPFARVEAQWEGILLNSMNAPQKSHSAERRLEPSKTDTTFHIH